MIQYESIYNQNAKQQTNKKTLRVSNYDEKKNKKARFNFCVQSNLCKIFLEM